jgi:site-specific DNA recombinase
MEKAGIIARVSTEKQLDNTSPDEQVRRCREYCQSKGYDVVDEKIESISGAFIFARSGFNALLELAGEGKLSVIVADKPDRLGRGDAIAKLELLAQMSGAHIEFATPEFDTSTAEGMVLKFAHEFASGIERSNIGRRTKEGKEAYARQGRVIATRYRTYGYDFVNKYDERGRKISCELAIRPEEAKTVRMIYQLFTLELMTSHAIAKRLTEMKIPSMGDIDPGIPKKRKGYWYPNSVVSILKNKTYAGEWLYGKSKVERKDTVNGVKQHYLTTHSPEAIPVEVPAIISMDTWLAAQSQLKANRKKFVKPTRYSYLLRGLIRCAKCGGMYIGGTAKSKGRIYRYYHCRKNHYHGVHKCNSRHLRADFIEPLVWHAVQEALLDDERLVKGQEKQEEELKRGRRIIETSIAALEAQSQKDQGKLSQLLDMVLGHDITREVYRSKVAEVKKKIEERQHEIEELEERLQEYVVMTPEQKEAVRKFRQEIESRLTNDVPNEEKRKLLDILRVEIIFNDDTREINVSSIIKLNPLSSTYWSGWNIQFHVKKPEYCR